MASPVDISVFGGYFPFSTRYSLDLPVLFQRYGLNEIWKEAYDEVEGVEWLSAGAWDPCHIFTKEPIRSLADMNGKRVFGVPTAGRFLARYGLIPVTVPWDDVEVARSEEHTSELQSLMRSSYAVFCLKKKIATMQQYNIKTGKTIKSRKIDK